MKFAARGQSCFFEIWPTYENSPATLALNSRHFQIFFEVIVRVPHLLSLSPVSAPLSVLVHSQFSLSPLTSASLQSNIRPNGNVEKEKENGK